MISKSRNSLDTEPTNSELGWEKTYKRWIKAFEEEKILKQFGFQHGSFSHMSECTFHNEKKYNTDLLPSESYLDGANFKIYSQSI